MYIVGLPAGIRRITPGMTLALVAALLATVKQPRQEGFRCHGLPLYLLPSLFCTRVSNLPLGKLGCTSPKRT